MSKPPRLTYANPKAPPPEDDDPLVTSEQIRAELERRVQTDAWRHFILRPTQRECDEANKRYSLLTGRNRMGKSAYWAYVLSGAARRIHPRRTTSKSGTYLLLAPNRKQLQHVWAKKLLRQSEVDGEWGKHPFIPAWEIEKVQWAISEVPEVIHMANGNQIMCAVSGDKNIFKRLMGIQLLGAVLDEGAGSMSLFDELYSRVLDTNSDPLIVQECGGAWIGWGATDVDGNPMFSRFIDQASNPVGAQEHGVFWGKASDEPEAKRIEREKLRGVVSDYDVRHDGSTHAGAKLAVYGEQWSDERHVVRPDYEPQPDDNLWVGFDDGLSHPLGIVFGAVNKRYPARINIWHAVTARRQTYQWVAAQVAQVLRGRQLEGFVYDIAMHKTDRGTGKRCCDLLYEALKYQRVSIRRGMIACHNRHEPGIHMVKRYLAPAGFMGETEPLLLFNASRESGCMQVVSQMKTYRTYAPDDFTGPRGVVKANDDLCDPIRYLCMARPHWVDRGPNLPKWEAGAKVIPAPAPEPVVLTDEQRRIADQFKRSEEMYRRTFRKRSGLVF